ncbi:MAG: hypothetical protein DRH57_05850, partial [Candidatus Cloacimonadota bacterium]
MKRISIIIVILALASMLLAQQPVQVKFHDYSGGVPLGAYGNLLHFMLDGGDGVISPPDGNGNPTGDDAVCTNPQPDPTSQGFDPWWWSNAITCQPVGAGAPGEAEIGD